MNKKPPVRPGITLEVGARVEAQDYLQKWYPSRIEKIDYEQGRMLVHFDRWSHRYDEWIFWDSDRLRPLDKPALHKPAVEDEEEMPESLSEMAASRLVELPGSSESAEDQTELQQKQDLRDGEEVLARWTDCRYYPAKIETINKDGTYTVQFYDGVIRCVKRIHIKCMPEDAKGQDWIALVKAATDAAKSKGNYRPRTSANSNRAKEVRTTGRSDSEAEEVAEEEEADSEKPETETSALEEDHNPSPEKLEVMKSKRRKSRQRNLVGVKKASLKKGLLTSKTEAEEVPDCKEEDKDEQGTPEYTCEPCEGAQEPSVVDEAVQPPCAQRHAACLQPDAKGRSMEPKEDCGQASGTQTQARPPSRAVCAQGEAVSASSPGSGLPDGAHTEFHALPRAGGDLPTDLRCPLPSDRRRRSRRLAPFTASTPPAPVTASPPSPDNKGPDPVPVCQADAISAAPQAQDTSCVADSPSHRPSASLPLECPSLAPVPPPPELQPPELQPPELQPPELQPPASGADTQPGADASSHVAGGEKTDSAVTDAVLKAATKTPKSNKHAREPIINLKKSEASASPKELIIDLDHNKFKCKVPGCGKAFRKAKLLDYHLKYYHNAEKEAESEAGSPQGAGRVRTTSATVPASSLFDPGVCKRRRTVSTSSSLSPQSCALELESADGCPKPPKFSKNMQSSISVSMGVTEVLLEVPRKGKHLEHLRDNDQKKVTDKDRTLPPGLIKTEKKPKPEEKIQALGKKKDKERKDKKEKFTFRVKQKKKKKKKKKSKQHSYADFDDVSLAFMRRCSSPLKHSSSTSFSLHTAPSSRLPRAILSVDLTGEDLSDMDSLEDSTTESALLSGDDYRAEDSADLDSLTMEDFQEEDDCPSDIVRCVCEMDEENGFMIQCEECLCWQHSVCMGLLEHSIPDQYICYVCRDPPGQRWSSKHRHHKDWMTKGHMYGLSFLAENYSHSNAEKIVSTHQLLSDVYSVNKVLHGLHLKMDILQNKRSPSLHLWARSWVNSEEEQAMGALPDCLHLQSRLADGLNLDPLADTYITSEHSYQKPSGPGLGAGPEPRASGRGHLVPLERGPGTASLAASLMAQSLVKEEQERTAISLSGFLNADAPEAPDQTRNCLEWQLNLLTHIEDLQSQVAGRMDLIEKEVDVLESWLDFTGELEPPEPLARLPQLKRRIKQLLTDLGKVQQISTLCSV